MYKSTTELLLLNNQVLIRINVQVFFQSDLFFHQLTKNTTYLNLPRNLPQSQFVYKTILGKSNVVIWINCQLIKE